MLRAGRIRLPYFAHQTLSTCRTFIENESEEHIRGKYQLSDYFTERGYKVEIEKYLSDISQRSDLMLSNPDKHQTIIIEYQCSPITLEKLKLRNQGYQKINLPTWWILGKPYQKRRLQDGTWAKFAQVTGLQQAGLYFWNTENMKLFKKPWLKIDGQLLPSRPRDLKELANIQLKHLLRQSRSFNGINRQLYQMKRSLWGIPWELHNLKPLTGGLKYSNTLALVQLYLFIEAHQHCTENMLFDFIKTLPWYEFGSIDSKLIQMIWLKQVLEEWERMKLIMWQENYLNLFQIPKWFDHLDLKISALQNQPLI